MRRTLCLLAGLAGLTATGPARAADPPEFEFRDGDRVVLIGDALIERDQKYGYLETLLTLLNPDKTITFRNLGWSGDTVAGLARAGFGTPADGFTHLKEHALALKPTVVIVGYGMTDSFDGEAGLPRFVSGLNELLDVVREAGPRAVVLLSPVAHADLGRPLPDPTDHNAQLERYSAAIGRVAADRGARFVDLFHEWRTLYENFPSLRLTDDGIHLTEDGYWLLGVKLSETLLGPPEPWSARFHHNGRLDRSTGTAVTIDRTKPSGVHFEALDATLPIPVRKLESRGMRIKAVEPRMLFATGLPDGSYRLTVDGATIALAWELPLSGFGGKLARSPNTSAWAGGVELRGGPEFDQVERLRAAINAKNALYFYRWRPQNETYLFGFRKHEQGNNAREVPLFDPLVAEKEKEIARLKVPVPHVYELRRVGAKEVAR